MKPFSPILLLLLLSAFAGPATAQSVDDIIDKVYAAKGGKDKWAGIHSIRYTGKMYLGLGMSAPFSLTVTNQPANGLYNEFTVMERVCKQAVTNTSAWQQMPFNGKRQPEAMDAEAAALLRLSFDIQEPLYQYKQKGHSVALLGKEKLEDDEVYKLKLTLSQNMGIVYYYVHTKNYLILADEKVFKVKGKEVRDKTFYKDYVQHAYGIWYPITASSEGSTEMTYTKVEINLPVDAKLFEMPPPPQKKQK